MAIDPHDIPSPFYRVAIKALVFDDAGRLLVVKNEEGLYELLGGGWEFDDESLEACLRREVREEIGVGVRTISNVLCSYRRLGTYGSRVLRLVVRATLDSPHFTPGDDIVAAEFVTEETFAALPFVLDDKNVLQTIEAFWPAAT